jgi:hypothetical protein
MSIIQDLESYLLRQNRVHLDEVDEDPLVESPAPADLVERIAKVARRFNGELPWSETELARAVLAELALERHDSSHWEAAHSAARERISTLEQENRDLKSELDFNRDCLAAERRNVGTLSEERARLKADLAARDEELRLCRDLENAARIVREETIWPLGARALKALDAHRAKLKPPAEAERASVDAEGPPRVGDMVRSPGVNHDREVLDVAFGKSMLEDFDGRFWYPNRVLEVIRRAEQPKPDKCLSCGGTGSVIPDCYEDSRCPACNGTGKESAAAMPEQPKPEPAPLLGPTAALEARIERFAALLGKMWAWEQAKRGGE